MQTLLDLRKRIVEFNKNENVPYEKKNFYLVMVCTIPILFFAGIIFNIDGSESVLSLFCIIMATYVALTTFIAALSKDYIKFSYWFCILINFFFIPMMFFMSEGIHYGMSLFFVLGIILTIVLLGKEKISWILVPGQFIFDIGIVLYSYFHNERVLYNTSIFSAENGIALSFALIGVIIISLFNYQNYINREMSKKVDSDNEAIQKAEMTKGRFLANMTHEIRTPMNAIIGMTDLILKEDLPRNIREYTDLIKTSSSQLLQIINNILEFSKLDSGRAELVNNEYSFRKMIEEVVNEVAEVYEAQHSILHVFLAKDIPDRLFGDEVRIRQVLRYILFSPLSQNTNGSVNMDISFDYDEENRVIRIKFRIASTGVGLTQEEIAAIYNAYSNYDSRQKTDYNRTGLEFSICQKILHMMEGTLSIESIEAIGNAVSFDFANYVVDEKPIVDFTNEEAIRPLIYVVNSQFEYSWKRLIEEFKISATYVRSPLSFRNELEKSNFTSIYTTDYGYPKVKEYIEAYECEDKTYIITTAEHSLGDFGRCRIIRHPVYIFNFLETINGKYDENKYKNIIEREEIKYPYARVLCVDDSPVNLKVLENLLKDYDIKSTKCKSGKEALELVENDEFDLLLIDQKMPEMDGTQLLHAIKQLRNPNSTIPAICATADSGNGVREALQSEGFTDYLAKPIDKNRLESILKDYLAEELRVVRKSKTEKVKPKKEAANTEPEVDPLSFDPQVGIANLGGSKEAYLSVLLAYYEEGVSKVVDVPIQFTSGDISLYTTNVHALKSSSATVGCMGISPLFKSLEFAGKENNTEFIANNSPKIFDLFAEVLESVREYLVAEDALSPQEDNAIDEREEVALNKELLNELSDCVAAMNLRRSEEIIELLLADNYGADINAKIKSIKNSYENFEYMEMKTVIEELL